MATRKRKKKNGPRWGTSYFVSLSAAKRYYKDYGDDEASVRRKVAEGSIHIGKPPLKPGQRLFLLDGGKRYGIEEVDTKSNPAIPRNKWVRGAVMVTRSGQVKFKRA